MVSNANFTRPRRLAVRTSPLQGEDTGSTPVGATNFSSCSAKIRVVVKKITEKVMLPIAVTIAAVILGIAFYAVQYNKQQSIERQQTLKLEEEKRVEDAKAEQAQKEYAAKRKLDCLKIYESQDDKWSNVLGWRYLETDDQCFIRYRADKPKSDAKCDKDYPTGGDLSLRFFRENLLCKEGEFENSF